MTWPSYTPMTIVTDRSPIYRKGLVVVRGASILTAALLLVSCGGLLAPEAYTEGGIADAVAPDGSEMSDAWQDATAWDSTTEDAVGDEPPSDAGSEDGALNTTMDGAPDAQMDDASDAGGPSDGGLDVEGPEASASCDADAGCYVIPAGWSLVAYSATKAACPPGFAAAAPTNFSGYAEPGDACTCGGCAVDYPPTCDTSGLRGFYGVNDAGTITCGIADPPTELTNNPPDACHTDLPQGDYSGLDLEYDPAPVSGSCSSTGPGTLTSAVTFPWTGETCAPDSPAAVGCEGSDCTVSLQPPFRVCVEASPFRVCPANSVFTQPYFGAVGPSAWCTACDCAMSATCSGTVRLFSDGGCAGAEFDVPADSQCHPAPAGIGAISAYRYEANGPTDVACAPSGASMVETSWQYTVTVCCAP